MTPLSRRALLGGAGGAALGALSAPAAGRALRSGPTDRDWRALAASLDGALLRPDDGGFDRVRVLRNSRFDDVVPAAVVRARGTADVAEAVRFARRFDLPLRPRAGGHSYVGDSTVADGLVIDVRRMRAVRYDEGTREVRVGAGVSNGRVVQRLAGHGRTIPTGTCPTVGLAGLALGGGLGIDSRRRGLTCDALTELTLVTADGAVRRAGPGDPLFWAAQGGGGGTFGVVTSMRFRTHPARPMGLFTVAFAWRDAAAAVAGWGAYMASAPRSVWCNLELAVRADGSRVVRVLGRCRAGQEDRRIAEVEAAVGRDAQGVWAQRRSFLDAVDFFAGPESGRTSWVAGSDVVPAVTPDLAASLPPVVAARAGSGPASVILDPLTGAVQDVAPSATAFPWRRHAAELQWFAPLPDSASPSEVAAAQRWVADGHDAVDGESVGAYVNRVEPGRVPRDYFAGNLRRLRTVKTRFDPDDVFTSPHTLRAR